MNEEGLKIVKNMIRVPVYAIVYLGLVGGLIELFGKTTRFFLMASLLGVYLIVEIIKLYGFEV